MKTLSTVFLGLCLALMCCSRVKELGVSASYSKEGKQDKVEIKLNFVLLSTAKLNKKLGELEVALAEVNAKHGQVRSLANQIQQEYAALVYELRPARAEPLIQLLAAVRPANGENGTALEQLEQRVQFVEFQTNSAFLALGQTFEEICHLTGKSEEWKAAQRAKMEALTVSIKKIKRIIADIEVLAPGVAKEASRRPHLRNPLVRMQNEADFLGGLVTLRPENSLEEQLLQVSKDWKTQDERPNLKLAVQELGLTELAKRLQAETAKSSD